MENKKPGPESKFAEVTRKSQEARAKLPQQSKEPVIRTTPRPAPEENTGR